MFEDCFQPSVDFLASLGCLFAVSFNMDPEDTKYARLFGRDREDACVTLALSIDEEKTTHEKKFELRSLMLKWSEMKKPRPAPDSLGNLPIFQTKDKSLKRLTTTFAPPSVEPYDVTSRWEEVLGLDNYRNLFLDYSEDLQRVRPPFQPLSTSFSTPTSTSLSVSFFKPVLLLQPPHVLWDCTV